MEELKQWLSTVSNKAGKMKPDEISKRLEYCRQILLRGHVFQAKNERSFVSTLAEVSKRLELLLQRVAGEQFSSVDRIGTMLSCGFEVVTVTLHVLLFAVTKNSIADHASREQCPDPIDHVALIAAAEHGDSAVLDWTTDVGRCLRCLLSTEYLRGVHLGDGYEGGTASANSVSSGTANQATEVRAESPQENDSIAWASGALVAVAPPDACCRAKFPAIGAKELQGTIETVRLRWQGLQTVGDDSGLFHFFCGHDSASLRMSFLDLMQHTDRLILFLAALRPYHRLAGIAGDIAMCRLYPVLSHLLQELEDALVKQRQARMEVMLAAKMQLQQQAKDMRKVSTVEVHWMQGLRHIDEFKLDELYGNLIQACTRLRAASTASRAFKLKEETQEALGDIVSQFASADFQSRCALALPEGLVQDMRQAALAPGDARRPQAIAPP